MKEGKFYLLHRNPVVGLTEVNEEKANKLIKKFK